MQGRTLVFVALLLVSCVSGVAANIPTVHPQFWHYGLLITIWTHSPFYAMATAFIVWLIGPVGAIHRTDDFAGDPSGFLFMGVYLLLPAMTIVGSIVGFLAVTWMKLPQLLDVRVLYRDPKDPRKSKFSIVGLVFALGPVLIGVAILSLGGHYLNRGPTDPGPNTSPENDLVFAIIWSILGFGLAIVLIVMVFYETPARLPLGRRIAAHIQLKYLIVLFMLFIPSQAFFDGIGGLAPPLNNLAGTATLIGIWILVFIIIAYTWKSNDTQIRSVRGAAYFCVVVGLASIFGYAIPLGAMFIAEPTVAVPTDGVATPTVIIAILIMSLIISLVYFFVWVVIVIPSEERRRASHAAAMRQRGADASVGVGVTSSIMHGATIKQRASRMHTASPKGALL